MRALAVAHARQTAARLTAAAYDYHEARVLGGWHPDYDDELPMETRMALMRPRARRCATPGCTLHEYHPGLCTSQRISGQRVRKPSALKRGAAALAMAAKL